ncbi:MAG TPA: hypothetical protein VGG62_13865 [Terracidiphilus sp.]|jgi:hypothetical protein
MARLYFVNGFVSAWDATRCSGFAGTATADNAIAAKRAALKPGAGSGAAPTAGISGVRKGGSIIATASGSTGVDTPA